MEDNSIADLYAPDTIKVFRENYNFLAALFDKKGMARIETSIELSKEEFMNLLTESAILVDRG